MILSCAAILTMVSSLGAEGLNSAKVVTVFNDVWITSGSQSPPVHAKPEDVLTNSGYVRTGNRSRTELVFKDMTLTRLGPNTVFSFNRKTRELQLESGSLMIHVFDPSGACKLRAAGVTAGITGTTLICEASSNTTRLFLLESKTKGVALTHASGDKQLLRPGETIHLNPKSFLSSPQQFNVSEKWKSSETGEKMGGLPSGIERQFQPASPSSSGASKNHQAGLEASKNAAREASVKAAQTAIQRPVVKPVQPSCTPPHSPSPPCSPPRPPCSGGPCP